MQRNSLETFIKSRYGPSGSIVNHDGLCILPINIINEKIYVFLWYDLRIFAYFIKSHDFNYSLFGTLQVLVSSASDLDQHIPLFQSNHSLLQVSTKDRNLDPFTKQEKSKQLVENFCNWKKFISPTFGRYCRYLVFCSRAKSSNCGDIAIVMEKLWFGDWFILMQVDCQFLY